MKITELERNRMQEILDSLKKRSANEYCTEIKNRKKVRWPLGQKNKKI